MTKLYNLVASLSVAFLLVVNGCSSAQKTASSAISQVLGTAVQQVSQPAEATLGGLSAVGAICALLGVLMWWVFSMPRSGIGMVVTGISISISAYMFQEMFEQYADLIVVGTITLIIAGIAAIITNSSFRAKLKKIANKLYEEGDNRAATALEREADPSLDKQFRKPHKKKIVLSHE